VVKTLSVGPLYYVLGFKKAHEMVKPLN
jgi:hypothetical protein